MLMPTLNPPVRSRENADTYTSAKAVHRHPWKKCCFRLFPHSTEFTLTLNSSFFLFIEFWIHHYHRIGCCCFRSTTSTRLKTEDIYLFRIFLHSIVMLFHSSIVFIAMRRWSERLIFSNHHQWNRERHWERCKGWRRGKMWNRNNSNKKIGMKHRRHSRNIENMPISYNCC